MTGQNVYSYTVVNFEKSSFLFNGVGVCVRRLACVVVHCVIMSPAKTSSFCSEDTFGGNQTRIDRQIQMVCCA